MTKRRSGPVPAKRPDKGLAEVLKHTETLSGLAKLVDVWPSSACRWKRVPVEYVLKIEKKTGISRYVLRPDIYGRAP